MAQKPILFREPTFETKNTFHYYMDDKNKFEILFSQKDKNTHIAITTPKGGTGITTQHPVTEFDEHKKEYLKTAQELIQKLGFLVEIKEERPTNGIITNWTLIAQYEDGREEEIETPLPQELFEQIDEWINKISKD